LLLTLLFIAQLCCILTELVAESVVTVCWRYCFTISLLAWSPEVA